MFAQRGLPVQTLVIDKVPVVGGGVVLSTTYATKFIYR